MTSKTQRPQMRLSPSHERWLYIVSAWIYLTGANWLLAHFIFAIPGVFWRTASGSEPWWLRMHGAAAMGFLITFGSLLPGHITRAWQARKNYRSGLLMLGLIALLVLTGYGLYYTGDEQVRPWVSVIHWALGVISAAGLLIHVRLGKRRLANLQNIATPEVPICGNTLSPEASKCNHVS